MSSEKITMFAYLSERVPTDVHFVLNKFGKYRKARDSRELEEQIKHFVRNYGENGLKSLAEIHPDRELIETTCKNCEIKDKEMSNFSLNKGMQDTFLSQQTAFYNAIGENGKEERIVQKMAINGVLIGGFVLMGVALMLKK
jgi:hypothetical protein|tara:strand:- start:242 stop:664 length:423 start_codon:yes stop_codon:yes gene_type:complete